MAAIVQADRQNVGRIDRRQELGDLDRLFVGRSPVEQVARQRAGGPFIDHRADPDLPVRRAKACDFHDSECTAGLRGLKECPPVGYDPPVIDPPGVVARAQAAAGARSL